MLPAFFRRAVLLPVAIFTAVLAAVSLPAAAQEAGGPMFPGLANGGAAIQSLTIETQRYALRIERRGDSWVAAGRGDFPVRISVVDPIIASLSAFVATEIRTNDPAEYAALHVEGPGPDNEDVRITATDADGNVIAAAILGATGTTAGPPRRSGLHVRLEGEADVWMAEGIVSFPRLLTNWFEPFGQIPGPSMAKITILAGDRPLFVVEKTDFSTGAYQLTYLDEELGELEYAAIDINEIRALAGAIVTIAPEDVRSREAVTVAADARVLRFETRDGLVVDATIATAAEEPWVILAASTSADATGAAVDQAALINEASEGRAFAFSEQVMGRLTVDLSALYVIIRPGGGASY
jgi:hypothetical protein